MSLSDAALGHDEGGDGEATLKVEPIPMDSLHAAAMLLKALESKDVHAIDDALRMHWAACDQEDDDDGGEEDEGY